MKHILWSILTLAMCLAVSFATANTAYAQMKIGVVDLQLAIENTKEGKAAKDKLDKMTAEKQKELDARVEKIKKMEEDIQKQLPLLDDKGKKDLLERYKKEMMELQKMYVDNQTFLQKERNKLLEPILKKMNKVIQDIALSEGFTLILDKSDGAILYHAPTMDITQEVIKRYNTLK